MERVLAEIELQLRAMSATERMRLALAFVEILGSYGTIAEQLTLQPMTALAFVGSLGPALVTPGGFREFLKRAKLIAQKTGPHVSEILSRLTP